MSENEKEYRKPTLSFIGAGEEELYRLEEEARGALGESAEELGRILGLVDFYREMLPEALAQLLVGYDSEASELAAIAYLESRGYSVGKWVDEAPAQTA